MGVWMSSSPSASGPNAGTLLEREMREQGTVLADRAEAGRAAAREAAGLLRRRDVSYVLVAGRGSSDNAARYAQYLLGAEAGIVVALATPSLYAPESQAPDLRGAAVLGLSQSGQSPDVVAVLEAAGRQRRPTVAIVNDPDSPLAAAADSVVPLAAGQERSVAATKTYLASLHALVQLLDELSPDSGRRGWLDRAPDLVGAAVDAELRARDRFDPLDSAAGITVVGRGLAYATAHETALKIRELAALPTETFSPPDLLHGPIAGVRQDAWIWLTALGRAIPDTTALLAALRARAGGSVVAAQDAALTTAADIAVALPSETPAWLAALLATLPGQAAALRLAERRRVSVDEPHGLSKVTHTR
jgi:glutamine---fructose-6-phosphate transaminase (isomerizing)